jgi:hypothetical protein
MASAFFDVEVFTDKNSAEVRAAAYGMDPGRRNNVRVIEAGRALLHESKGAPPTTVRKYDSTSGSYWIVISEG